MSQELRRNRKIKFKTRQFAAAASFFPKIQTLKSSARSGVYLNELTFA
jgi:hypothetical protein